MAIDRAPKFQKSSKNGLKNGKIRADRHKCTFENMMKNREIFLSGHSAVGSAPRSGRGGRGFKSRCSDHDGYSYST